MTDEPKLTISDAYKTPTVFVNQVVGAGILNSVVNLTLGTAQFTPRDDSTVDTDLIITSRLRMDLFCAQQVHEQLGRILAQAMPTANDKPS